MINTRAAGRTPHLIATSAATGLAAVLQLAARTPPANMEYTASLTVGIVWSILALLGSVCVLIGLFIKDAVLGLHIEGAGHVGLVFGWITYVVAAIAYMNTPWYVSPAVWWSVGLMVASTWRAWQIYRIFHTCHRGREGTHV